jgi:hypothetical protein
MQCRAPRSYSHISESSIQSLIEDESTFRKYTHDKLPAVSAPKNYLAWVAEEIAVDAKTVANLVNDIVSRA